MDANTGCFVERKGDQSSAADRAKETLKKNYFEEADSEDESFRPRFNFCPDRPKSTSESPSVQVAKAQPIDTTSKRPPRLALDLKNEEIWKEEEKHERSDFSHVMSSQAAA